MSGFLAGFPFLCFPISFHIPNYYSWVGFINKMCALTKIAQLTSVSPVPKTRRNLGALSFYFISFPQLLEAVSRNSSQLPSLLDGSFPLLALEAPGYGRRCPLPAPFLCWKPTLTGPLLLAQPCPWSKNKCRCSAPTSWKACDLTANKLSVFFLGQSGCKWVSQKQTCCDDKLIKNAFFPATDSAIFPVTDASLTLKTEIIQSKEIAVWLFLLLKNSGQPVVTSLLFKTMIL